MASFVFSHRLPCLLLVIYCAFTLEWNSFSVLDAFVISQELHAVGTKSITVGLVWSGMERLLRIAVQV